MPLDKDPTEANHSTPRVVQRILDGAKAQSIHIGRITQTIVYLGLPLNSRHLRFVQLLANSAYLTCLVGGFIRLWQNGADSNSLLLLIVGSGLLSLTCLYYAGFWKPEVQDKGAPMVRRLATVGVLAVPLLTCAGFFIWRSLPAPHVFLLVANLDGVEQQNYQVTENILRNLRNATKPYADVKVQALNQTITEQQGSEVARTVGEQKKASIVIWGSYGVTSTNVQVSVHFEVLKPPDKFPKLEKTARGEAQTLAIAELKSFKLQTRLSNQMSYLTLFTLGMVQYAKHDWDGAIDRFKLALDKLKEPVTTLGQEAVYFYLGSAHSNKSDYKNAVADYTQALQLKPDSADIYHNRGLAYSRLGKYPQAIADYNQALKLQPDSKAYYNRGDAYLKQRKYPQALADYNQALKLKPNYTAAYYGRGLAYSSLGNYTQALADYNQALELKPGYADVYHNRGLAYSRLGKYPQAIADYNQALKLQPDSKAYYNKACIYSLKKEVKAAIENLQWAIDLDAKYREKAKTDSDLDNIREDKQFQVLVGQ
jgi:tetratricopeptide (TPR) repeat protein